MAIKAHRTIVRVSLPRAEALDFLEELTLDLGLRVRLLHARMTEQETRLLLEMAGEPERVMQGIRRSEQGNVRLPFLNRAS